MTRTLDGAQPGTRPFRRGTGAGARSVCKVRVLELEAAELTLLLDGIELSAAGQRPRYRARRDAAASV